MSEQLEQEIKELIVSTLALEEVTPAEIESEQILFGEGLGLDSVDALELGVALNKKYGITIDAESEETRQSFACVSNLAKFVSEKRASA